MSFSGFTAGGTNTPALRDDFNRADSTTPGSSWSEPLWSGEGGGEIVSNTMRLNITGGNSGGIYWGSDESSADMAYCATITTFTLDNNGSISIYTRVPSTEIPLDGTGAAEDYYRVAAVKLDAGNDELRCFQVIDGTGTQLTPATGANSIGADWAVGDKFGYTIRENAGATEIVTWRLASGGSWVQVATFSSTTAGRKTTAGRTAVEWYDGGAGTHLVGIDDLRVEDYVVTSSQFLAPSADSVDGNWTDQGGGTSLFAAIDETTASDADYIRSELSPSASACRIKLTAGGDPASSTGHKINWRAGKDTTGGQTIGITVKLYQGGGNSVGGGTLIASFTRSNVDAFTDYVETLSGGQADSITNYGDLYLEFSANAT